MASLHVTLLAMDVSESDATRLMRVCSTSGSACSYSIPPNMDPGTWIKNTAIAVCEAVSTAGFMDGLIVVDGVEEWFRQSQIKVDKEITLYRDTCPRRVDRPCSIGLTSRHSGARTYQLPPNLRLYVWLAEHNGKLIVDGSYSDRRIGLADFASRHGLATPALIIDHLPFASVCCLLRIMARWLLMCHTWIVDSA